MKKYSTLFLLLPTLFFLGGIPSFAQNENAERLPVIKDEVRDRFIERNHDIPPQKEKNGELPKEEALVPSPEGVDVLVNNNTGGTATGQFTQSETSILAFGNNVVIGFNDAGSFASGSHFTGWSYSTNSGASFIDGGVLPASAIGDAGDPVLARNETTGRIYFATLGFNAPGNIQVYRSDDGGITWSPPANGTPGGSSEDKEWITVDNFVGAGNGNVYLISRRFSGATGIYVYRSVDGGLTFSPGVLIDPGNQGAFIVVGPDHSVYAFWYAGLSGLRVRKSVDQGLTFAAPVTVATGLVGGVNGDLGLVGIRQGIGTPSAFRSSEFPHVAVNPVSGHLYVTYDNKAAGADKADIFYVMSTDGGATWSAPVRVNDDATTTDQWMPTIAVSPNGANIGFFYYSRQEDPVGNNLFKYYGRTGIISGSSVILNPSFPVSDVASLPEFGRDDIVNLVYMGDYNHAVATNSKFHVVWADNRSDYAAGPPRKDPNVYYEGITIGPPCPINPATNPSPANGATNLAVTGNTLSWTNGSGATQLEIWFGELGNVLQVYNGSPISSFSLASFEPLDFNKIYQWRIVGKNDTCNVGGSFWSFTTMPDPNLVIDSLFCEPFESGLGGWTITNDGGTAGCVWMIRTAPFPNAYTLPPAATGGIMTADVDECGSGSLMLSTATLNQAFDFSIYTTVRLEFDNDWLFLRATDEAHVEVSVNAGPWVGVWDKVGVSVRNSHEVVDISSVAAGHANVKFRLRSVQPLWDWWWVLDNFCLYGEYTLSNTFPLTVNVANGWNMVSIPGLLPTNQNVTTWWPGKDPTAGVFKFQGGYQPVTVASPGIGYWMKNLGAQTYNTGDEWPAGGIQKVAHAPITAAAGWNLFGGYEQSVPTSGLTTTPPGLITGSVYEYLGGYVTATTLTPGYGYWVKLTGAGSINIPSGPAGPTKVAKGPATENLGKIIIIDNAQKSYTLYTVNNEADLSQFDLPPYPPQGMFDVRYSSQRYAERLGSAPQAIEMTGVQYPVKIKADGVGIILSDETGKEIARLKTGEEITINSAGKLFAAENVIPSVYALEQNYPNPFNPSTTIQFSIPEDVQNVKLIIYSALGEKVAELVNTGLQAGVYKYNWNASDVSSGLYIYQIVTKNFVQTKKMMLLK